jgi:hypothetical protein
MNPLPYAESDCPGFEPFVVPKTAHSAPIIHWLGDDGARVFVEVQGRLVAVAVSQGPASHPRAKRQHVNGFSAASRHRLFKAINRLDANRGGKSTFATFTWRDELGRPSPEQITQARSEAHRWLERTVGRPVAGIWRVEWKDRKTGRFRGQPMPHIHGIYFQLPYVPAELWGAAWARSIGCVGRVSFKVEKIRNLRQTLYYVSKYVAKQDALSNLDIPSYLNKYLPGRKWGIYRKNRLPLAERVELRVPIGALLKRIRAACKKCWDGVPWAEDAGFTCFGPASQEVEKIIHEWACQNAEHPPQ